MKKITSLILMFACFFQVSTTTADNLDTSEILLIKPNPLDSEISKSIKTIDYVCDATLETVNNTFDYINLVNAVKDKNPKKKIKEILEDKLKSYITDKSFEYTDSETTKEIYNKTSELLDVLTTWDPIKKYQLLANSMASTGCSLTKIWFLLDYTIKRENYDISKLISGREKFYKHMLSLVNEKEESEINRYYCWLISSDDLKNRLDSLYNYRCDYLFNQRKADFTSLWNFEKYYSDSNWDKLITSLWFSWKVGNYLKEDTLGEKLCLKNYWKSKGITKEKILVNEKDWSCTDWAINNLKKYPQDKKMIDYFFKYPIKEINKQDLQTKKSFVKKYKDDYFSRWFIISFTYEYVKTRIKKYLK